MASGKGGVGRSFLTANLGCLLARDVGPATLLDLDFSGGNLHTFLGQHADGEDVSAFFDGRVDRLDPLLRTGEVPGLHLVRGVSTVTRSPVSRRRDALLEALRQGPHPFALLDLESGSSDSTLSFFRAADRPILVVLPEPAAIENAHGFIRRLFARELEVHLRQARSPRTRLWAGINPNGNWRPSELLSRLDALSIVAGRQLRASLRQLTLHLVLNQVRHASDIEVGMAFKRAVEAYFGIRVRFVGAIGHDGEAWLSARKRRLRLRESSCAMLEEQLERTIEHLVADTELEMPSVIPPL